MNTLLIDSLARAAGAGEPVTLTAESVLYLLGRLRSAEASAQAEHDARQAAASQAAEVRKLARELRDALRLALCEVCGYMYASETGQTRRCSCTGARIALTRADALLGTVDAEQAFERIGAAE